MMRDYDDRERTVYPRGSGQHSGTRAGSGNSIHERGRRNAWLALILVALAGSPATAQTVTDGDRIHVGGVIYRLWGIDAPQSKQTCENGWPAGQEAIKAMRALVEGRTITCDARGTDRHGRTIGLCSADGMDLGASMIRAGMAWAFVRDSYEYFDLEHDARNKRRGVHAHACQPAWEWRAQQRR